MEVTLPLSDLEISWSRQENVKVATPEAVGKKANTAYAQTAPEELELAWQWVLKDYIFQAFMYWEWKR